MKKTIISVLAIIFIALLSFWGCSKDDPTTATATPGAISGVVTEAATGNVLGGAGIVTTPATSSTTTNTAGEFFITGVSAGTYTVTASHTGYRNASASVAVTAGNTAIANIELWSIYP